MAFEIHECSRHKDYIYQKLCYEAQNNSYIVYLRGARCDTEESFFREVSAALQFPWYFGENWAAFDECICDLEWLKFDRMVLAIDDFKMMFNEDREQQKQLLKYLCIMVEYWKAQGKSVEVWLNN